MINKLIPWVFWGVCGLVLLLTSVAAYKGSSKAIDYLASGIAFAVMGVVTEFFKWLTREDEPAKNSPVPSAKEAATPMEWTESPLPFWKDE